MACNITDSDYSDIEDIPIKLDKCLPLDAQKSEIRSLLSKPFQKGDKRFLVHIRWFKQWEWFVGFDTCNRLYAGEETARPGPIDNSSLLENQELRKYQVEEIDYKLVPEEAWRKLVEWYGMTPNSVPICRRVVEYGKFVKQCKVEVYPLELKACLYPNKSDFKLIRISRADSIHVLEKKMRRKFQIGSEKEVRIYNRWMMYPYELIKDLSQEAQDVELCDGQCVLMAVMNQDGSWPHNVMATRGMEMNTFHITGSSSKTLTPQFDNYDSDSDIEDIPVNLDNFPSFEEQKCQMKCFLSKPYQTGQKWFLVHIHWFKQWKQFVGYDTWDRLYAGEETARPGPIDNYSLLENQKLRRHQVVEIDYKLVPEEAWRKLVEWYGLSPDSVSICRRVIEYRMSGRNVKQCKVEVYLIELKACIYPNENNFKIVRISRRDAIHVLDKKIRKGFEIDPEKEVRIYSRYNTYTHQLIEDLSQQAYDVGLFTGQRVVMELRNKDGSWPRSIT